MRDNLSAEDTEIMAIWSRDPQMLAERQCLEASLLKALDHLPDDQATVVRMLYGLDWEPPILRRQISREMGASPAKVNKLHKHAMKNLQEYGNWDWAL